MVIEKKNKVKRHLVAEGVSFKTCLPVKVQGQIKKVAIQCLAKWFQASTVESCGGNASW